MQLQEFNELPAEDVEPALRGCADVDRWVASVLASRPYADLAHLLAQGRAAADWSDAELDRALAHHPRIGERASRDDGGASAREQSGVSVGDRDAFVEANRRYEERFGRIYLVRAAGRAASELLELLEERLTHDQETELAVTKQQLGEIAVLRLERLFEEEQ